MKDPQPTTRPNRIRRSHVVLSICLGLMLSLKLFLVVADREWDARRQVFEQDVNDLTNAFDQQLSRNLYQLEALGAFFEASEDVTPDEFQHFLGRIQAERDGGTGYEAVEWIPWVAPYDPASPGVATDKLAGGSLPIAFVSPSPPRAGLLGRDQTHDAARASLLESAARTNRTVAGPLGDQPEMGGAQAVFICRPVFRQAGGEDDGTATSAHRELAGFVAMLLAPDRQIDVALKSLRDRDIDLYLVERETGTLLDYSASGARRGAAADRQAVTPGTSAGRATVLPFAAIPDLAMAYGDLYRAHPVMVGNRQWVLYAVPGALPGHWLVESRYAFLVLGGCLMLTGVLGAYLLQRRRYQQSLLHNEENLVITLHSIGDAVIATDAAGRITRMNPTAEALTGWSLASAAGHPLGEVVDLRYQVDGQTRVARPLDALAGRVSQSAGPDGSVLVARDGSKRIVADTCTPIQTAAGDIVGVVLVCRDITEQRQLEEQLRQVRKLESIGRLAGGVAHDFNNLLVGIMGYNEMLAERVQHDADMRGYVAGINEASERARDLIQQLLGFSRKSSRQTGPVNLHDVVQSAASLLARTLDKRVSIQLQLRAEDALLAGDGTLLNNTLLNLAVNAGHAMPEGGTLTFATTLVTLSEAFCAAHPQALRPGAYIELSVTDTGSGMDAATLSQIFEPFFTTKPEGQGTGLGLATAYGTVKDHGGFIHVASEVGRGTVFKLYLPLLRRESDTPRRPTQPARATILVVDDEPVTAMTIERHLTNLGYTVMRADSGTAAVALYRTHHASIDAVILDMVMPDLNGTQVLAALRAISPNVRVVLATAFLGGMAPDDPARHGFRGFLAKPFTAAELKAELRTAMA